MTTRDAARTPSTALAADNAWHKSSYSSQDNGNCVEVAELTDRIGIRDSKDKQGPALLVTPTEWTSFVEFVRGGTVDFGTL